MMAMFLFPVFSNFKTFAVVLDSLMIAAGIKQIFRFSW